MRFLFKLNRIQTRTKTNEKLNLFWRKSQVKCETDFFFQTIIELDAKRDFHLFSRTRRKNLYLVRRPPIE